MSKRKSEMGHFRRRARERFGVIVNESEHNALVKRIKRGEFPVVERQSHRVSVFEGELGGQKALLFYDHNRGACITAMTQEMYDQMKKGTYTVEL